MKPTPLLPPSFGTIPSELKSRAQWVLWKAVWQPDKGKYNKIPINARIGGNASSTNQETWSSFDDTRRAYERNPATAENPEKGFAGVGFALAGTDPFCGIDLDHVITKDSDGNMVIDESALAIINAMDTYTEISPSGTGIRLFVVADLPPGACKRGDTEAYDSGRYLTVTGMRWEGTPPTVNERQAELEAFHAEAFPAPEKTERSEKATGTRLDVSDTDLLAVAFKAKNGANIAALYAGSTAGYIGASEADFALCGLLAFYTGADPARLERLVRGSGLVRDKWDELRSGETWIMGRIRKAIDRCPNFYSPPGIPYDVDGTKTRVNKPPKPKLETEEGFGGEPDPDEATSLPVIVLTDRQDRNISADAWEAVHLANTPPRLFARGMGAACLARDAETGRVAVQDANEERMLYRLRRVANFVTVRQTKAGELQTNNPPPLRIARDMLFDSDQVGALPVLRGVVNAPVVGPDGAILATPGYHPSARLYVATEGLNVTVPDAPTKKDAQAAYDRLFGEEGVFGEFPYASDTDRANAASYLFTLFARPYIGGNVPMFLWEAPEKGTGKTLGAEAIASVFEPSTAARPAPTTGTREQSQIEWSKVLTSALRSAPSLLLFDNVQGVLASAALEGLITASRYTDRILGTAEEISFDTSSLTIAATSNNPEISEDMQRRVNVIRLDAEMERPTDRQNFRIPDLKKYVKENRGIIISDVLTILSAWLCAGAVQGKAHKASFERWASVLSGVFDFLEVPGFLAKEDGFSTSVDPEKAKWAVFAAAVYKEHGTTPKRARELLVEAIDAELLTAIYSVDSVTKEVTVHNEGSATLTFSKRIKKQQDRVFNGLKLTAKQNRDKIIEYVFIPVEAPKPKDNHSPRQQTPPVDTAPIMAFVAARCVRKPSVRVSEFDLLKAYNEWAKETSTVPDTYYPTAFNAAIASLGGVTATATGADYSFSGIGIKASPVENNPFDDPFAPVDESMAPDEGEID